MDEGNKYFMIIYEPINFFLLLGVPKPSTNEGNKYFVIKYELINLFFIVRCSEIVYQ